MNPAGPHVLVARLDNAGDVLLTGPAVRAVACGARQVTYVCGPQGRDAAELLPGVGTVVELDAPWVPVPARPVDRHAIDRFVATVRVARIDQAVILTSFHQSPLPLALLLRLAGVPTIAATSADYPGSLLDHRLAEHDEHEVLRSLRVASALGHRLAVGDDARLAVRRPLRGGEAFDGTYVVVHPGASVPARALPADGLVAMVAALVADGWNVALTGSAAESALVAPVRALGDDAVVDLSGTLDLPALAGVLAGAAAVVCGNTGPAHLAAAVGTPVVSVFAPVVPWHRWRPWGVPTVRLGVHDIECAGCRATTCPIPGQPCVSGISPAQVVEAVRSLAPGVAPAAASQVVHA